MCGRVIGIPQLSLDPEQVWNLYEYFWLFGVAISSQVCFPFFFFLLLAQQPPSSPTVDHDLLIHEVSRSHTLTHHSRTSLDEWSARVRDLYLTTHNIHNRQTFMSSVGFEPTNSSGERPLGPGSVLSLGVKVKYNFLQPKLISKDIKHFACLWGTVFYNW